MVNDSMFETMKKLRDLFPTAKVAIGGSYARSVILKEDLDHCNDVDVYLNVRVCRYMFREIVEKVLFPNMPVEYISDETGQTNLGKYRMPHIIRRVTAVVLGSDIPPIDFIFLNPRLVPDTYEFLRTKQACPLSECFIHAVWDDRAGDTWVSGTTSAFRSLLQKKSTKRLYVDSREEACTPEHLVKIKALAVKYGLTVVGI